MKKHFIAWGGLYSLIFLILAAGYFVRNPIAFDRKPPHVVLIFKIAGYSDTLTEPLADTINIVIK